MLYQMVDNHKQGSHSAGSPQPSLSPFKGSHPLFKGSHGGVIYSSVSVALYFIGVKVGGILGTFIRVYRTLNNGYYNRVVF